MIGNGSDRASRDEALTALRDVLIMIETSGDLAETLTPTLTSLSSELAAITPDLEGDLEVKCTLDWMRWLIGSVHPSGHEHSMATPDAVHESPRRDFASVNSFRVELTRRAIARYGDFEQEKTLNVLCDAVSLFRCALHVTSQDCPNRAAYLSNLGNALVVLFQWSDDLEVLDEALQMNRDAVAASPSDHADRPQRMAGLVLALHAVFDRTGKMAALEEAVEIAREVAKSSLPDSEDRAGILSNLVLPLHTLFEQTGNMLALEEAVRLARGAVAASSKDFATRASRAYRLSNLAAVLQSLYEWGGDAAILKEAVRVASEADTHTPPGDIDRAVRRSSYSTALHTLFEWGGNSVDQLEAVRVGREAVQVIPLNHPSRAAVLSNLSSILKDLFDSNMDRTVLEEALRVGRDAVTATPSDSPNRAGYLTNLGATLRALGDLGQNVTVLDEALRIGRDAVAATPADHPNRAKFLGQLSMTLQSLYELTGDPAILREAQKNFIDAASMETARSDVRIFASRCAADLALLAGDPDDALDTIERAVELIPHVASRVLGRADRQHRMATLIGLASTAAEVAIAAQEPSRAIELLEQTRGVVLADTLDTRNDLAELRRRAPELALELNGLRQEIEVVDYPLSRHEWAVSGIHGSGRRAAYLELVDRRVRSSSQWSELLGRIRKVRGFESFLLPLPIDELRKQANRGPIVYVTAHRRNGHALIMVDNPDRPIRIVDLPEFTERAASEQAELLRLAQEEAANRLYPARERAAAQRRILNILAWLWDNITEPVLRELGYISVPPPGEPWPRVWWCPVGVGTSLPLHAAGYHLPAQDAGAQGTVMDRVISSYTPTIRALASIRSLRIPGETGPTTTDATADMMIVAVPDAPWSRPLAGVADEVALIRNLIPEVTVMPAAGTEATLDTVTAALRSHRIVHFACHGIFHGTTPASSHLVLHDHLSQPLTVTAIARLDLTQSELAFLSACSTTNTSREHADEATHITAAFHLAGYRNVIGTLWSINDRVASSIANYFYGLLTAGGTQRPDSNSAASALHAAIRHHRSKCPSLPTQWAAHIHVGG